MRIISISIYFVGSDEEINLHRFIEAVKADTICFTEFWVFVNSTNIIKLTIFFITILLLHKQRLPDNIHWFEILCV